MGYGAMRFGLPGVVGPPENADEAAKVLREAVELGVTNSWGWRRWISSTCVARRTPWKPPNDDATVLCLDWHGPRSAGRPAFA